MCSQRRTGRDHARKAPNTTHRMKRAWRTRTKFASPEYKETAEITVNIFCYPGVTRRIEVCGILGIEPGSLPEFGFMPRIPLFSEATERTEVDMKLGNVLFEAKLTEGDFQIQRAEVVEQYRDLREVFESRQLPRTKKKYVSYQLIRNVLAAHALGLDFCTLLDARRPDLIEDWFLIVRCIREGVMRAIDQHGYWIEGGSLAEYLRSTSPGADAHSEVQFIEFKRIHWMQKA